MTKLDAKARDALPNSAFAYIDSKGNRALPIHDAEHTRAAMARFDQTAFDSDSAKATARKKILAAAKKFDIDVSSFSADPEPIDGPIKEAFDVFMEKVFGKDEPATMSEPLTFSAEIEGTPASAATASASPQDMVIRTGKLFECGNYPDRSFAFDEHDLERAVASFEPVPVDLEHVPTVLEGRLGHVQRIFPGDDGKTLMGEVHLPKWLDSVLEDGSRKVSATWDRASKRMLGLALVRNPRVSDAALMAAFSAAETDATVVGTHSTEIKPTDFAGSRHDTPSGQIALQMIHDRAASGGAVCKRPASMASRHESSTIQQVHDLTVQHGATCESSIKGSGVVGPAMYSEATPHSTTHRSRALNIKEWLTGKAQEEGIEFDATELEAAFSGKQPDLSEIEAKLAAKDQEIATFKAEQERHQTALAQMAEERRQTAAVTFAQGQVAAHKLTPAAAEKLVPLASRIASLDSTVTFAEGEKSTSALLQEFADSLTDLSVFTTENIRNGEAAALFNVATTPGVDGKEEADAERVKKMLAATPIGRRVLAEDAKNGK